MFNKKAKRITELAKQVRALEDKVSHANRSLCNANDMRDHYRELYIELEKNRPRTVEEQLFEARRVQKELMDKRTLAMILEANAKALQENN